MSFTQITPEQTKRRLDADDGTVYLDVRTAPEFQQGHAPGAFNIPVAEMNPAAGRMELRADFVSQVKKHWPKDAKLVLGCKTGGRSTTACQLLAVAGYTDLANLVGGFMGIADAKGQVTQEGWSTLGYPIERGPAPGRDFASLSAVRA